VLQHRCPLTAQLADSNSTGNSMFGNCTHTQCLCAFSRVETRQTANGSRLLARLVVYPTCLLLQDVFRCAITLLPPPPRLPPPPPQALADAASWLLCQTNTPCQGLACVVLNASRDRYGRGDSTDLALQGMAHTHSEQKMGKSRQLAWLCLDALKILAIKQIMANYLEAPPLCCPPPPDHRLSHRSQCTQTHHQVCLAGLSRTHLYLAPPQGRLLPVSRQDCTADM
jgi:hypothetical protein